MATIGQLNKFVDTYKETSLELNRIRSAVSEASEVPLATKCVIMVYINGEVILNSNIPIKTAGEYFNAKIDELQAKLNDMDAKLAGISVNGV